MGDSPSSYQSCQSCPVEGVSWLDAVLYCNALSLRMGLSPAYQVDGDQVLWNHQAEGYRLPTEAEWECVIRPPATGAPLCERIREGAEIFHGPHADEAPDLIAEFKDWSVVASGAVAGDTVFSEFRGGVHRMNGILVARGEGIRAGKTLAEAEITDLPPTILHLLGLPVPADLDARVLTDAFSPTHLEAHPIRRGEAAVPLSRDIAPDRQPCPERGLQGLLGALGYLD